MMKTRIFSRSLRIALTVATLTLLAVPGTAQAITQRDWMIALVDSLGRSFGLPDEPKADDYAGILEGKRSFRFEAESTYSEDDEVTVRTVATFGPFSGSGWLLGTNRPTTTHLRFTLPLGGRFQLAAALRHPGHTIRAGGRDFAVDGDQDRFARIAPGEIELTAGPQEIVVVIPPGGAVDYVELTAPNLPPIAPGGGWRADAPLTWEILALTTLQALGLQEQLPLLAETALTLEAETLADTGGAAVVADTHLGRPGGGRWLRTQAEPATVAVPLNVAASGYYDLELTMMGAPIGVLLNNHLALSVEGKPYLDTAILPAVFLAAGPNRLDITLPPGAGLDRLALKPRQSDLAGYAGVLGLTPRETPPENADLDRLSARLAATAAR